MATIYNQSDSNKLHVANIIKYNYGLKNSFTMCRSCTNSICYGVFVVTKVQAQQLQIYVFGFEIPIYN